MAIRGRPQWKRQVIGMRNREKLYQKMEHEYGKRLRAKMAGHSEKALTIDDIEQIAVDLGKEMNELVAQELTQDEAESREAEPGKQKHPCRCCNRWVRFRGHGDRTILTRAGVVRVRGRREYYCAHCDTDTVPVDEWMRLPAHGYTAHVERLVAEAVADQPPAQASKRLERMAGLYVSPKEMQRIGYAAGEHVRAEEKESTDRVFAARAKDDLDSIVEQRHDPGITLYLGGDGIHTPTRMVVKKKGSKAPRVYKESKVACVYVVNKLGRQLEKHYIYHMGVPGEFGRKLYALVVSLGLAETARVIALGDGAPWIWRQIRNYFPHAVQVLDWYHATEHLYATAAVCYGEVDREEQAAAIRAQQKAAGESEHDEIEQHVSGPEFGPGAAKHAGAAKNDGKCTKLMTATRAWVKRMEALLLDGKLEGLIEAVKALPKPSNLARNSVRRLVNYLTKNKDRMKYNEYIERGHWIGSGFIESACKQVVGARLKGPGMCWSVAGAKAMGALRALILSGDRWDTVIGTWRGRPRGPVPTF
jgi:hypothetical protein